MLGSVTLFDNPADLGARVADEERKLGEGNDALSRWPTFGEGGLSMPSPSADEEDLSRRRSSYSGRSSVEDKTVSTTQPYLFVTVPRVAEYASTKR